MHLPQRSEALLPPGSSLNLRGLQCAAKLLDGFDLLRECADEFEPVQKTHAVPHHRSDHEDFRSIRNGEFQSNHFSRSQFTGNDGAQSRFRELEATAMYANVPILRKHLNDYRDFCTIAGVTPRQRLMRASNALKSHGEHCPENCLQFVE
jgi:hypothetical protein